MKIETITPEDFDERIGEAFVADDGTEKLNFRLVEVRRGNPPIPGVRDRTSFAAIFVSDFEPGHPGMVTVTLRNPNFGELAGVAISPVAGVVKPEWGDGAKQVWSIGFA